MNVQIESPFLSMIDVWYIYCGEVVLNFLECVKILFTMFQILIDCYLCQWAYLALTLPQSSLVNFPKSETKKTREIQSSYRKGQA